MALVWFYLQINGKPNEKLLDELLWTFNDNDFNRAFIWLMMDDEEGMNETELQMKKLISKHFETENELTNLTNWSKYIFKQVAIIFRRKDALTSLQHASYIPRASIYVSIVVNKAIKHKQHRESLSGKYNFHSTRNNKPAFIHESKNYYLVFDELAEEWQIQPDKWFAIGKSGGFLRRKTKSKYLTVMNSILSVRNSQPRDHSL